MTWERMLLDPRSPFWLCILQKKSPRGRRCDRSGDELEGVAPYGLSCPCQGRNLWNSRSDSFHGDSKATGLTKGDSTATPETSLL